MKERGDEYHRLEGDGARVCIIMGGRAVLCTLNHKHSLNPLHRHFGPLLEIRREWCVNGRSDGAIGRRRRRAREPQDHSEEQRRRRRGHDFLRCPPLEKNS